MTDDAQSLTPPQRQAVEHIDGPMMVVAGPGSGKTRVVTCRIAHLLQLGISARQIVALTFTNKAADEMRRRVKTMAPGKDVWVSTFHRFCSRLLRQYASLVGLTESFTIYDSDDSRKVVQRAMNDLNLSSSRFRPEKVAAGLSRAKNQLIPADRFEAVPGDPFDHVLERVYPRYQELLVAASAVDFDDLLLYVAILLHENAELRAALDERFRYTLVDEYQDTNRVQDTIVRGISVDYPNLSVTGDPDQSIYAWRGANLENMLQFKQKFPQARIVRLEQNFRSTKRILEVSDVLISNNRNRLEKSLFTDNDAGTPVRLVAYPNQNTEADDIATRIDFEVRSGRRRYRDFAILYRTNALSRACENALRRRELPYQMIHGLEFYQRRETKDVLAYLHLLNNPRNDLAFGRIVNVPPRGIGKKTVERLTDHATRFGLSLLDAARQSDRITGLNRRAQSRLTELVTALDKMRNSVSLPLGKVVSAVLEISGYECYLDESDDEYDQSRLENIQELVTDAEEFERRGEDQGSLEAFLEQASLVNDTDDWEVDMDKVTLMTMHAAKGLEFPAVYIIAVEDGLLPHERCRKQPELLEEERRLLFVGITRAQYDLQLSYAVRRQYRGRQFSTIPSQFLMELPRYDMQLVEPDWGTSYQPEVDDVPDWDPPPAETPEIPTDAKITTGARLAGAQVATGPSVAPEAFDQGMTVTHPDYGPGKIIDVSGSGTNRRATVAFAAVGQKKFVLAKSPLRPVRRE